MSLYNVLRQMIPKRGHGLEHPDHPDARNWGNYILFPGSNILIQWGASGQVNFGPDDTEDVTRIINFSRNYVTTDQFKVALSVTTGISASSEPSDLMVTTSVISKFYNSVTVRIHRVQGSGACFISAIAIGIDESDPTVDW